MAVRWGTFVLREVSDGKLKGTYRARSRVRGASRKSDRPDIPATLPGNATIDHCQSNIRTWPTITPPETDKDLAP
jgi:hypothetical protein